MSTHGVPTAGRITRFLVVLGVLAAVTLPGSPVEADTSVGRFNTLPGGTALGLEIDGVARIHRGSEETTGRVLVRGLEPGMVYAAHVHNQPCGLNAGGAHYRDDPGGAGAPPNELWFSGSDDPTAGIRARRSGVARGSGAVDWVARPEAQSVVIHQVVSATGTSGGPKLACADLG